MTPKYKNIYVLLPHNYATGGVELAHQLVDYLRCSGMCCYAVYIENDSIVTNPNIPEVYKSYNVEATSHIKDDAENIVVIPETMTEMARLFHKINIACWWMSVDNFTKKYLALLPFVWNKNKTLFENIRKNIHLLLSRIPLACTDILEYFRKNKNRVVHLYQSEYARQYIISHKLGTYRKLSDYINPELFPNDLNLAQKQDIVLYNPLKGLEYTKKIIEACPDIQFIPLKGLSRTELNTLFDLAKLYIDFGNFPGKDRLTREAVLHKCCIITGKLGASKYYEDVPIDDSFKIDTLDANIPIVVEKVKLIFANYETISPLFERYRQIVKEEQQNFYNEINDIFIKE